MGKWVHIVRAVEGNLVDCQECGWVEGVRTEHNRFGLQCSTRQRSRGISKGKWPEEAGYHQRKKMKKDHCEMEGCSYPISGHYQLELDHIDGDWRNNDPSNLQTLCCNCHRLKTYLEKQV